MRKYRSDAEFIAREAELLVSLRGTSPAADRFFALHVEETIDGLTSALRVFAQDFDGCMEAVNNHHTAVAVRFIEETGIPSNLLVFLRDLQKLMNLVAQASATNVVPFRRR